MGEQYVGRVVHCKRQPFDVYIGRPSKWGNPFPLKSEGDRQKIIAAYRAWVKDEIAGGRLDVEELRGKVLGCFCAPKACHGDVLLELLRAR